MAHPCSAGPHENYNLMFVTEVKLNVVFLFYVQYILVTGGWGYVK